MEYENTERKGFSSRAENEEFRDLMRGQINKNFRYLMISLPLVFLFIVAITFIICKVKNEKPSVAIGGDAVALVIILIIFVVKFIKYLKDLGKLNKGGSVDGTVIKNQKSVTHSDDKPDRRTYLIVIETDAGTKIKVKNDKAMPYYSHLNKGDRVRYHYGFVYPIELYDKSVDSVSICPFCGKPNSTSTDKCQSCGKPLLV